MYGLFFAGTNEMVDTEITFTCPVSAQKFVDSYSYMYDEDVSVEVREIGKGLTAGNFYALAGCAV